LYFLGCKDPGGVVGPLHVPLPQGLTTVSFRFICHISCFVRRSSVSMLRLVSWRHQKSYLSLVSNVFFKICCVTFDGIVKASPLLIECLQNTQTPQCAVCKRYTLVITIRGFVYCYIYSRLTFLCFPKQQTKHKLGDDRKRNCNSEMNAM